MQARDMSDESGGMQYLLGRKRKIQTIAGASGSQKGNSLRIWIFSALRNVSHSILRRNRLDSKGDQKHRLSLDLAEVRVCSPGTSRGLEKWGRGTQI